MSVMKTMKIIVWMNLVIGLYNMYLYSVGDKFFNLIIGSINIGVWVFYRGVYDE